MDNNRRTPGRRTQAESERTRARILDRSEQLFARRGFGGVSLRELAAEAGVQHRTIQHHFGSKVGLYRTVLERWDEEIESRLADAIRERRDLADMIDGVVDEIFDFLLAKRSWVTVTARATMGEEIPEDTALNEQGWLRFMDGALERRNVAVKADLGLLLISVEGLLNNHVLAKSHYEALYGRDVTDPRLKRRTKEHLKTLFRAMLTAD